MTLEDSVREDIAFIRRAVEQGRGYAAGRSLDMLVWGVAVAIGYLATYATAIRWWRVDPNWIWAVCIVLPWLYSLRRLFAALIFPSQPRPTSPPMVQALRMLWFGCGIFLSTLAVAVIVAGDMRQGWFNAVTAGIMGIGFFTSSYLCSLAWMRWVAVGWWIAALLLYALRQRVEVLPLSAVLMLLLLALPGLLLWRGRPASTAPTAPAAA
jgi:hypothetical protein